jgi:hypothetical protein
MLKKFNLVVEEILNDMKLNFRFNRSSRFLARNLNKSEKQSLNEKYNEIVKSTLKDLEGSDQKIRICYYTDENSIIAESGYVKSVQDGIVNWVNVLNKEKITPIDRIIIEPVTLEIWKDEEKFKNKFNEQKDMLLNDISNLIQSDLKYLVEHEYIRSIDIANGLALCSSNNTYTLTIRNNKVFEDQKVLEIFNVDISSKKFEKAKNDAKTSSESWYYCGGMKLILKVIMNISEGLRFDVTRIKEVTFESVFEYMPGHGTSGEF